MPIENPHLSDAQEIEAASRWSRLAARLVDGLVWCAPLPFIFFPCLGAIVLLAGLAAILIAQIYLLVTRAQTLGKKALGIYIMRSDGSIPHIGWLLVREFGIPAIALFLQFFGSRDRTASGHLLIVAGSLVYLVDVIFIFGPTRRCLHDFLAGTHVVKV